MGSGQGNLGVRIAGDGSVTIDNQIAMGSDAGGVDLCDGERSDGEGQQNLRDRAKREIARAADVQGGLGTVVVGEKEHGCTSVLR